MFFEKFFNQNIDLVHEAQTIYSLLERESWEKNYPLSRTSIYKILCEHFSKWNKRGTYVNFDDYLDKNFQYCLHPCPGGLWEEENSLEFLEMIFNLLNDFFNFIPDGNYFADQTILFEISEWERTLIQDPLKLIFENLYKIADKTGYEFKLINRGDKHQYYQLVRKSLEADVASQCLLNQKDEDNKKHINDIYKYLSVKSKGNLADKEKILLSLYTYYENYKKCKIKEDSKSIKNILDDTSFLANSFVRHGAEKGLEIPLKEINCEEKEKIYDTLFDNYLISFILISYLENDSCSKIKLIKEQYIKK